MKESAQAVTQHGVQLLVGRVKQWTPMYSMLPSRCQNSFMKNYTLSISDTRQQ